MKANLLFRRISTSIEHSSGNAIFEIVRPNPESSADRMAVVARRSLLDPSTGAKSEIEKLISLGTCVVIRTGLSRETEAQDEAAASLLAWGPKARHELDLAIEHSITAAARRSTRVLLWPHARDVLSDIPSGLSVLRRFTSEHFGLIVQPRDMLTEPMLPRAEEHIVRIVEAFEAQPGLFAFADGCRIELAADQSTGSLLTDSAVATLEKLLGSTQKPVVRAQAGI